MNEGAKLTVGYAVVPREGSRIRELLVLCTLFAAGIGFLTWALIRASLPEPAVAQIAEPQPKAAQRLIVTFLDIGEGDSTFIQTPGGKTILIDGGMSSNEYSDFNAGLHVILPFLEDLNINHLDWVVATHPHNDHIGGLVPVLRKIPTTNLLDCGMDFITSTYEEMLSLVKEKNIAYHLGIEGMILDLDPAIHIQILHPIQDQLTDSPNNNSIVIRLQYRDISFLFAGDIEAPVESRLARYGSNLQSTFLKVPHHGSDTSSTALFVDLVNPIAAFFPCGLYNRHGHPNDSVIERYRNKGIKIYRTDRDRHITVVTDGYGYKIVTNS